ncbi:BON domain-containing protein [Bremerella alba]|uniref:BON domain-containing protein n=1 Tax=Bremerella alba TaxID=980252 RepID=A0A7V8V362_9BACT|nr:hypothetical protein [Bremerella alba]
MRFNRIEPVCVAICGVLTCGLTFANAQGQSVNSDTVQQPTTGFGSSFNSNSGGTISSPGTNMFSTPLPQPSFGSDSSSGTSGLGGTTDSSAASGLTQQNQLNPFGGGTTGTGQLGLGANSRRNSSFGAFGNLFNNQAFQNGTGQDDTPRLPTKLTVKFNYPQVPSALVNTDITRRIRKIGRFPNVIVSVEDRVATVSGIVESEDDLRLVERFVSLEVGVSSVVNQIELQEPSPADQ